MAHGLASKRGRPRLKLTAPRLPKTAAFGATTKRFEEDTAMEKPRKEVKGDWVLGWPDRKRPRSEFYKDTQGRVVGSRSPFLDLEGLIAPAGPPSISPQDLLHAPGPPVAAVI